MSASKPHSEPEVFWLTVEGHELDEALVRKSAYDGLLEQLETYERALRDIVHLPDETQAYSYADACVNIARAALNPASEPKEDA